MSKIKYLFILLLILVVVCLSNLYSYYYGFSEARKITVLYAMHVPSSLLNECAKNPNEDCINEVNEDIRRIRFFLARELLEDGVGLDEESRKELEEIRDSYYESE